MPGVATGALGGPRCLVRARPSLPRHQVGAGRGRLVSQPDDPNTRCPAGDARGAGNGASVMPAPALTEKRRAHRSVRPRSLPGASVVAAQSQLVAFSTCGTDVTVPLTLDATPPLTLSCNSAGASRSAMVSRSSSPSTGFVSSVMVYLLNRIEDDATILWRKCK